jgi:dihydroneopterin aldolase
MTALHITHSTIFVNDIQLHAYHGVMPQEQLTGNDYLVSVSAQYPIDKAITTDDVQHTLNYAMVYDIVKEEMGISSKLVEHVAGRIAQHLMKQFADISAVLVRITKLNPPMGAQCAGAGVEVEMTR